MPRTKLACDGSFSDDPSCSFRNIEIDIPLVVVGQPEIPTQLWRFANLVEWNYTTSLLNQLQYAFVLLSGGYFREALRFRRVATALRGNDKARHYNTAGEQYVRYEERS